MRYFQLGERVSEAEAVDPKAMAWYYDLITHMPMWRGVHRRMVAGVLDQGVTQGMCLDLGTGPGRVALEIARQRPGLRMVGLDLAAHMIRRANTRAGAAQAICRSLWSQADAHLLPFADGSFDLVISTFALHHWEDPLRIFGEISRVLAPGGRYYLADLNREVDLVQRLFAYGSIPVASLPFGSYLGYGGYYESVRAGYTQSDLQVLLEESSLPPGKVAHASTRFFPILTMASVG